MSEFTFFFPGAVVTQKIITCLKKYASPISYDVLACWSMLLALQLLLSRRAVSNIKPAMAVAITATSNMKLVQGAAMTSVKTVKHPCTILTSSYYERQLLLLATTAMSNIKPAMIVATTADLLLRISLN